MTRRTIKTLGPKSAALVTRLAEEGRYCFTARDAATVLGERPANASKLLSDLRARKWVARVEKGKHVLLPMESGATDLYLGNELALASKLVEPYYISFWTAIYHYGYTEQVPRTVFVATTKQKRNIIFSGRVFRFVKLAERKFFGYKPEWIGADQVQIATPEKLLVDCLDLPQYAGGIREVAKLLWNVRDRLDWDKVADYCVRMGNLAVAKRLGFLTELLSIRRGRDALETLRGSLSAGYALLDPTLTKSGRFASRWRVQVNLPEVEIMSWRFS